MSSRPSGRHSARANKKTSAGRRIAGLAAAAVATVAALSGTLLSAPESQAAPGNTVLLGDSVAANPDLYNYFAGKGVPLPDPILSGSGCGTDNRFANAYAGASGKKVDNFSCAGSSYRTGGMHIKTQANKANAAGKLNGNTSEVVIWAGTNDTYPYVLNDKLPVSKIESNLRASVQSTVAQVKRQAPQANVKVVGMPHITNGAGQVCPVNLIPGVQTPSALIQAGPLEWALERGVRDGANAAGGKFVSLKPVSKGHEMCSNDRWVVGLIDTTSQRRNLPLHMTDVGLRNVGRAAANA
ncbi:MAG TPA: esterase [Candidatus Corynebacterium avicola]|uniref:Esterase n=1 Tax=Candidatus Corynebacterium avicola TaxID=2838527 RepID=A0A9D1UN46_9CORY|nr:esterase [Candidatus Corynebacterium avicola]